MLDDRPGPSFSRGRIGWAVAFAACLVATTARGQGPNRQSAKVYPDTSHTAEALLKNAENHARGGQFAEAIEIYQRVIAQYGDKVVLVPPTIPAGPVAEGAVLPEDSMLFVDARLDCQRRIAAMPPEARALYRDRVDSQAERWFKQGLADRDRAPLRRIVEQSFCSSWGDDALDLLGDLSFQEGQFAEALAAYRRLVPDRAVEGQGMAHPDPSVDLAMVAAKKLLCRSALGDDPPGPADLTAFAKAYPDAKGEFAGRSGPLVASLARALAEDRLSLPVPSDGRWPTFAGAPSRTKVAPGSVDVGSLQWRIPLDPVSSSTMPPRGFGGRRNINVYTGPVSVSPERLLAYHPIIVGEQVIVANERFIRAYNLNQRPADGGTGPATGAHVWEHEHQGGGFPSEAARNFHGLPRYTLTAFGDRIYARMGPPPSVGGGMGMGRGGGMGMGIGSNGASSFIVALDRATEGKLLWKRSASKIALPRRRADGGSRAAAFEGTPVADAKNVYVALTDRVEMTATYVACLDADNGAPRWVRYICEAGNADPFSGALLGDISHRLLTLDGPTLVYQTNLGAVASLDTETGDIRWLATYPWQGRNPLGGGSERDLNPAVAYNGLVIIAPDDTNALFAFDAATGRMVWKTKTLPEEVKLTHLLGVTKGRVVATGDRVLLFDVKTGALVQTWPDGGQLPQGYGRGILAGDRIYWPTKTEIHVLDQDGFRAQPSIKLQEGFATTGGNLAVGDGFLVVAGAEGMAVFCQNRRLIERYKEEIARAPDQAANYFRMAQAAEASAMDDLALSSFDQAAKRAKPSETIDGLPMVESSRDHQHHLLMKGGDAARKLGDWSLATTRFARAGEVAGSDRDRLSARLDLADVQLRDGKPKPAVGTLQSLLADERLRPLVVTAADGLRSVRADLLIADRLATIVRDHGRAAYDEFDRAADALLARGIKERDVRLVGDVGRSYPAAKVVPDAWLAMGRLSEELGKPAEAARAYKKLLAADVSAPGRARAYLGLARAYEAQRLWAPAREVYLQASARVGTQRVEADEKVADVVAARLARPPFDRIAGESPEPPTPLPLARRWGRQWPASLRPIGTEGAPPSGEQGRIYLVEGANLHAADPATGAPTWSANLGGETVWVAYLADRLIAATRTKIAALDLSKGTIGWQFDLPSQAGKGAATPFTRPDAAPDGREAGTSQFQDFRVVGGRVICLRGEQAILALDGDTGQVDWSYTPGGGRINPRLLVGPDRIVFQVRKPNAVEVIDTATGHRRAVFPQGEEDEWARDPLPIDDDHVALVADRRTVALFDLNRGVNAWVFRESKEMPKYGPPRILGDADRLLVLHNGVELIRLDPSTGARKWSRPLGEDDLSERPDAFVLAGETFLFASKSDLIAVSIADGSTTWKRTLIGPESVWSLALTDRCVVAYPNPSRLVEGTLSALPVVFRRRDDGALVQRLLFPMPVTELSVRLAPRGAFVATQAGLWALGDRREPTNP